MSRNISVNANLLREKVKKKLSIMGVSQKELAKEIDIHPVTLSRYLSGTLQPTVKNLIRIADYLDLSIDYLFNRKDNLFTERDKQILEKIESLKESIESDINHSTVSIPKLDGNILREKETQQSIYCESFQFDFKFIRGITEPLLCHVSDDCLDTPPEIAKGDYLVVDIKPGRNLKHNCFYLVIDEEGRRLVRTSGCNVDQISKDEQKLVEMLSKDERNELVGLVVWVIRSINGVLL